MHPRTTMALARQRPISLLALLSVVAALFLAAPVAAAGKTGQVTVFWGRNKDEGSLRQACDSGWYTMVTMSFLDVFGHGNNYHLDLSGHDLSAIGADIKHCQFIGVPVSLSIGGYGTDYSLPSNRSALDLFDHLWNSYFGGSKPGVRRPFGDAWLDGVDLFLEHGTPTDRYDVLALELAKHNIRGGPGKPLHLTATVRCAYPPAAHVGRALATGIFERVHMRIYEEDDKYNVYGPWETSWDNWTAAYPETRFYIGLTADMNSHQWIHPKNIYYWVAPIVQKTDNYGGFMIWDAYFNGKHGGYGGLGQDCIYGHSTCILVDVMINITIETHALLFFDMMIDIIPSSSSSWSPPGVPCLPCGDPLALEKFLLMMHLGKIFWCH